jgi:hypothetical protein
MEPERKIEKLLRAYAKKRRAQAGDPLTLPPAMRRLLQGEIARRKPKPGDDEEASVTLWELFRQRWALFAGFAVIVFFGAALFLPALSASKKRAQNVNAMNNLKEIGVAAQMAADENHGRLPISLDVLTNQLALYKVLTDPESGKPFIYIAGGQKLDGLSSNSVLAYSLADKKGHAVLFADGRVEVVNGVRLAELTNRGLPQLMAANESVNRQLLETPATSKDTQGIAVAAPTISGQPKSEAERSNVNLSDSGAITTISGTFAANAPAAAPPAIDQLAKAPSAAGSNFKTPAGSVQFATAAQNYNTSAQNSFKNTVALKQATAVLANFQVQQNGTAIRVVDADGSVYDGALQPEIAGAQNEQVTAGALTLPMNREKSIASRDEPQQAENSQMAQNYFFRVAGTNLTLKQNVVFVGNLLANFKVTANGQQANNRNGNFSGGGGAGSGGQLQSAITNQLPWSNSRIAGTAVISDTNNIEIDAVPQLQ